MEKQILQRLKIQVNDWIKRCPIFILESADDAKTNITNLLHINKLQIIPSIEVPKLREDFRINYPLLGGGIFSSSSKVYFLSYTFSISGDSELIASFYRDNLRADQFPMSGSNVSYTYHSLIPIKGNAELEKQYGSDYKNLIEELQAKADVLNQVIEDCKSKVLEEAPSLISQEIKRRNDDENSGQNLNPFRT